MKVIKKLFKLVVWTFVLLLIAVALLPLWIGPVVKFAANSQVPKIVKTGFHLGEFGFNPYTGRLHIGDVQLQNPERFFKERAKSAKSISDVDTGDGLLSAVTAHAGNAAAMVGDAVMSVGDAISSSETNAVSLKAINVRYAPASVFSKTVRIEEVAIDGLYFYGDVTFSNIREIVEAASSGSKDEKAGEPAQTAEAAGGAPAEEGEGRKVVIDRVIISGTKIQWGHFVVPLPVIEIKDIGKDEKGGADSESVADTVMQSIYDAADKAQSGAGTALKAAIDGASSIKKAAGALLDGAGKGVDTLKDAVGSGAETVTELADKGTEAVSGFAGKSVDTVSDLAGKGMDAIGGAAGKGMDAIGGAAGKGMDAIGGAASKGFDALKSLNPVK